MLSYAPLFLRKAGNGYAVRNVLRAVCHVEIIKAEQAAHGVNSYAHLLYLAKRYGGYCCEKQAAAVGYILVSQSIAFCPANLRARVRLTAIAAASTHSAATSRMTAQLRSNSRIRKAAAIKMR